MKRLPLGCNPNFLKKSKIFDFGGNCFCPRREDCPFSKIGEGVGDEVEIRMWKKPRVAQSRILATGLVSQRFQNFFGRAGFPAK
jgi:hypothetical protein